MGSQGHRVIVALMVVCASVGNAAQPALIDQIVRQTAACQRLMPLTLEIGDGSSTLHTSTYGKGAPRSDEPLRVASATKWISAAYFLEKLPEPIPHAASLGLRMLTGRTFFDGCDTTPTVAACFQHRRNSRLNPRDVGLFSYGSGHFAGLAMEMGLGPMTSKDLGREVQAVLGVSEVEFFAPNFAAGGVVTTRAYVRFLRKLLAGQLKMSRYLGLDPVCTLPRDCPKARGSIVPVNFTYSYGHWVEQTPQGIGDGVFSSVGMWGFYPWINPRDGTYGVIAARSSNSQAYLSALDCGARIRSAGPLAPPSPAKLLSGTPVDRE